MSMAIVNYNGTIILKCGSVSPSIHWSIVKEYSAMYFFAISRPEQERTSDRSSLMVMKRFTTDHYFTDGVSLEQI